MADVHSSETRSYNMSQIKGKDTKPEMLVRRFLHNNGFRYRLHVKDLPGRPDVVLPRYNVVIFIHGCFWHGHDGCRYFVVPKTKTEWWLDKIGKNKSRDDRNRKLLQDAGWEVIELFECTLKPAVRHETLSNLTNYLTSKLEKSGT